MSEYSVKPLFCHKLIYKYKYRILIFSLICSIISLIICIYTPKEWNANLTLVIGKDYVIESNGIRTMPIEPVSIIIERLKNRELQNNILKHTKIFPSIDNQQAKLFYTSLQVKPIKDTEALTISIKANSPQLSLNQINLLAQEIIKKHTELNNNSKAMLEQKKDFLIEQIENIKTKHLDKLNTNGNNILTLNLVQIYLKQNTDLTQDLFNVNLALQNIKLNPTRILTSIEVSEKAVYPKKSIFLLCGFAIGLLIGTIIVHLLYKNKH